MLPKKIYDYLASSPFAVRLIPFGVFLLLTSAQGSGEAAFWFYFAKTVVGAWMIWAVWPLIKEWQWAWSWEALAVGVGVFVMWVGLHGLYPGLDQILGGANDEPGASWNPHLVFGQGAFLAWFFIIVRTLGSSLVVPPLEEVVFRSTVYRYVVNPEFESVSFRQFHWGALLATSTIFALEHNDWLSGFLCGIAYQWLVIRKGRLGDAMTAHAITNFLLALWVVGRGAWHFW